MLAGVHPGCYELFAHEPVNTITDLKGRSVGIPAIRQWAALFISVMAAYVGLDPANDIKWCREHAPDEAMELFADGKIDAFLGFPPEPQELRARKVGRVIVSTATDKPWSQYFCCMLIGNPDYVRNYPVATKRVLRAILKAADMCAAEPTRAAQRMVDGGFTPRYDYALQALGDIPYGKWREYDPEDTIRFYALRLHELGFIKSSPNAAHRRGHRLALPERAQARAEGVRQPSGAASPAAREFQKGGFDADHSKLAAIFWPACPRRVR